MFPCRLRYLILTLAVTLGLMTAASVPAELSQVQAAPAHADVCKSSRTHPGADARGTRFMVATAHPLATEIGCAILERGGNAVDAAVAVQIALAVVEPHSSGLAGGTLITYWDANRRDVRFFEGLARAPETVTENLRTPTRQEREELGIDRFPSEVASTGRAFGIPGTVRVLSDVHELYGTLPWEDLFDDAITLARDGFPMSVNMHATLKQSANGRQRCDYPDLRARYCDGDAPKAVGEKLYNAELAEVLREVRNGGADAFYDPNGKIAPAIVERADKGPIKLRGNDEGPTVIPSLATVEDFAAYEAHERNPECRDAFGMMVCSSAPPASGGVTVLQMLGLLERGKAQQFAPDSPERIHLALEASRLANFDRREYVGDPDFHPVPVTGLLDSGYLDERFSLISSDHAVHPVKPGSPPGAEPAGSKIDTGNDADQTSHVSIVDAAGNAVSMTTTNNIHFGAQMEARGIILNNVQTNFTETTSISPGKPVNIMEPHKRPRTTMAPTIVLDRTGRLRLVLGAAGGGPIPDYVTQTLMGVLVDRMNPGTAIAQGHYSGQQITSNCQGVIGPPSELEAGTPAARLLDELKLRDHPCAQVVSLNSGLTAIEVQGKRLLGAADRRRDGIAIGR